MITVLSVSVGAGVRVSVYSCLAHQCSVRHSVAVGSLCDVLLRLVQQVGAWWVTHPSVYRCAKCNSQAVRGQCINWYDKDLLAPTLRQRQRVKCLTEHRCSTVRSLYIGANMTYDILQPWVGAPTQSRTTVRGIHLWKAEWNSSCHVVDHIPLTFCTQINAIWRHWSGLTEWWHICHN